MVMQYNPSLYLLHVLHLSDAIDIPLMEVKHCKPCSSPLLLFIGHTTSKPSKYLKIIEQYWLTSVSPTT